MTVHSRRLFWTIFLVALMAAMSFGTLSAHTEGGIARLIRAEIGSYWVYAWTSPEPLRVGMAHISVAVTRPGDGDRPEESVADANVRVRLLSAQSGQQFEIETMPEVRLETVYYETDVRLPSEGRWQVTLFVEGPEGSGTAEFSMEVLPPRSLNWTLIAGGAGLLVVVAAVMAIWMRASIAPPEGGSQQTRSAER